MSIVSECFMKKNLKKKKLLVFLPEYDSKKISAEI